MGLRRLWSGMRATVEVRRRWWALVLAACAAAACLRLPVDVSTRALFPEVRPAALAHLLADFSHHPHAGSWSVEEEKSNYTSWHYAVTYECGARCSGRALVEAHEVAAAGEPRHGQPPRDHRVRVALVSCSRLPLLPWPKFCDEMVTETVVSRDDNANSESGALLQESARTWCGALQVLLGNCGRSLRAHRDHHLRKLRAALLRG